MANLETLELTINGSAENAQQGINQLITSLGNLSNAITKPYSDLRDLCAVLKDIAGYCKNIKLPNVGKLTGAANAAAKAKKAISDYDPEHNNGRGYVVPPQSAESIAKDQKWFSELHANTSAAYQKSKDYHAWAAQRRAELEKVAQYGKGFKEDNRPLAQNSVYIKNMADNMYHYSKATGEANSKTSVLSDAIQSFKNGLGRIKDGIRNLTSGLTGFFSKVKRIATTMLIRSAIRGLIKSMKEGVKNLYEWSKLNNGQFAKSMDTLKNKAGELKNSIGAAISPVIQAAIPLLTQLANAAITALNWVNQLISLLTGKNSWTKATEGVHSYTEETNKATGAAKEWLATFDELNVMSSSGGSGGNSDNTDYSDMFEEMTDFEQHLVDLANFFKENAEAIKTVAIEAGAAFLGWKVSTAFSGVLGTIGTLAAAGAVIAITWQMTAMFDEEYIDTGEEGWLVADAVTSAVGSTLAGGLIKSILGTGAGLVTAGFTMLISGAISYGIGLANKEDDEAEAVKTIGLVKGLLGDLLIGAGFAVSTGSLAAGVAAALIGAPMFFAAATFVATIVSARNEQQIANEMFKNAGQGGISVERLYALLNDEFKKVSAPYRISIEAFADSQAAADQISEAFETIEYLNEMITSGDMLTQTQADEFKQTWQTVFTAFETKSEEEWAAIFAGFNAALTTENEELRKQAKEARITALSMQEGISEIEAALIDRMNELTEKIAKGTATDEEIQEYLNKVSLFAEEATSTLKNFKDTIKEAATVDFSGTEGIESAKEFFKKVTEQYRLAVQSIDEGLASQLAAIDAQKEKIQKYVEKGLLDPETGKQWIANLDEFAQQFKDAADENKQRLADDMQGAFEAVLNTAKKQLGDYLNEDGTFNFEGGKGADAFMDNTIRPLIQAIQDSDVDVDKALADVFDFAGALEDYMNYDDWSRECDFVFGEIGKIAAQRAQAIDLDNTVIFNAFNLVAWDDSEEAKQEIANKLAESFGLATAIRSLEKKYSLNISDIVNLYGWDTLSDDLKAEMLSTVQISAENFKELADIGISVEEIIKFTNYKSLGESAQKDFIKSIVSTFGASGIAEIKKQLPDISARNIISVTDWSSLTNEQKKEFVNAIKESYGSDAAKEAAKKAGIDISEIIEDAMDADPPTVKPQMDGKATDKTKKDINTRIGTVNTPVEAKETVKKTTEAKTSIGKNLGTFRPAVIATEDTKKTAATRGSVSKNLGTFRQSVVPVESKISTEYTRGQVSKHLGSFRQDVVAVESKKSTEYTKGAINKNIGTFKPAVKTVENVSATKATRKSTNMNLGTFEPYVKAKESAAATKAARKSVNTNIGTFTPSVVAKESVKSTEYTKGQIKKNIGTFTPGVVAKEDTKITAAVKSSMTKGIGTFSPTVNANENKSKTSSTRNSIESGIGTIDAYIEAKEKAGKAKAVKSSISDTVGTVNSYVYPYKNVEQSNRTERSLNDQYKTINAYVYAKKDDTSANQAKASIESTFKGMTASVSVSATLSNSTAFRNSVKGSLSGIRLSVKDGNGTTKQFATIAAAQSGGLFDSGDLFFANENGNAEMIGRFGNQTGVANQREIVAGIQKGVADANEEQNALLRQQNQILMGILQKSGNVTIGASSALGRVAKQSIDMYSALVGG